MANVSAEMRGLVRVVLSEITVAPGDGLAQRFIAALEGRIARLTQGKRLTEKQVDAIKRALDALTPHRTEVGGWRVYCQGHKLTDSRRGEVARTILIALHEKRRAYVETLPVRSSANSLLVQTPRARCEYARAESLCSPPRPYRRRPMAVHPGSCLRAPKGPPPQASVWSRLWHLKNHPSISEICYRRIASIEDKAYGRGDSTVPNSLRRRAVD